MRFSEHFGLYSTTVRRYQRQLHRYFPMSAYPKIKAPWLVSTILVFVFLASWVTLEAPGIPPSFHRFRPLAQFHSPEDEHSASFRQLLRTFYKPHQLIDGTTFRDYAGTEWGLQGEPLWTSPLGKRLCIVDFDTRPLDETGEVMDPNPLNWDKTNPLAAGMLNHYMYGECLLPDNLV